MNVNTWRDKPRCRALTRNGQGPRCQHAANPKVIHYAGEQLCGIHYQFYNPPVVDEEDPRVVTRSLELYEEHRKKIREQKDLRWISEMFKI